MSKTTVLIVEDEAIVAAHLSDKLRQIGYEVIAITPEGEEAVALSCSLQPDLVLMDISLKGPMDGIEAADNIRRQFDVPVVYLTAHSDAATLSRAKLTDPFGYILKPFEERELATIIEMAVYKHQADSQMRQHRNELEARTMELQAANEALRSSRTAALNIMDDAIAARESAEKASMELQQEIARRKRTEEELRKERDFTSAVIDTAGALVVVLDKEGRIVRFNNACASTTGYSSAEVLGRVFWEFLIPAAELEGVKQTWQALQAGQFPNKYENHWVKKDGSQRLITWSNTSIAGEGGEIEYIITTGIDITERNRAELALRESREDLNRAQAVAHVGSWRLNVQTNELLWSEENWRIFEAPSVAPLTYETFLSAVHPDDREYVDRKWTSALRGEPYDIEHRIFVNGKIKWVRERAELEFDRDGKLLGGFGTTQDITEKKLAEEQIEKLAKFPSENPNPVFRLDCDGIILYANQSGQSFLKHWGAAPGDRVPDLLRGFAEEAMANRSVKVIEMPLANSFWSIAIAPISDFGYVNFYGTNITERKKVEDALRASEERLMSALKAGDVFAFEWNPLTDEVIRSVSCAPILGLPPDESTKDTGKDFFRRIHPDDRDKFLALLSSLRPDAPSYETTYRLLRPDGRISILEESAKAQFDGDGRLVTLYGMAADVTERESALALLRKSEQELRIARDELEIKVQERTAEIREKAGMIDALFEYTVTPLALLDREFNFARVNKAYADVCMKDLNEFYGHNHFEFYPHVENEIIFKRVVETKTPYQVFAKPFIFPDHPEWGVTYWDWTLTPLLDGKGEVNFLVFSLNNVTERVKSQDRIKIERNRLKTILDTMTDGVLIVSREFEIQYVNPALVNDFGPVRGRKCYQYFHDLENACSWCSTVEVLAGKTVHDEWTYDATGKIYELLSTPFLNDDGTISKMQIFHDITKRKKAEEALKVERQRLYSVLEQLPAYVCLLTEEYTFSFVNQEFKRRFGDPGNRKCYEYLFDIQKPCEGCQTFRIFTERLESNQWEWTGPDGNTYAIFDYPFTDIDGTAKILEMGLDITKRKKAEESLRLSENRYRLLIEQASEGIALLTPDLGIIDVNPMACQIIGYSREELIGVHGKSLLYPEELPKVLPAMEDVLSGKTVVLELKAKRKDTIPVLLELGAKVIEGGMIQVLFRDITERREKESRIHITDSLLGLFAKTTSRQEYLESVVQVIHDWTGCRCVGIRVADVRGYIPYESYTGFSQEFWQLENMLSLDKDMCACIRTMTGQYEPQDASVLTPHGSVYINNSEEFLKGLTREGIAKFRGNCIRNGFLSIALIPIRYRGNTIGLIHLADKHKGKAPLTVVNFLESVSSLIGEAIYRFNTEEALRKSRSGLSEAQRIARLGNWEWDVNTEKMEWSDETYRIFGLSPQQFTPTYDAFLGFVHPDDREFLEDIIKEAYYQKAPYMIDHRIVLQNGKERVVHEQGEIVFNQAEVPLRIMGTIQDVTEQKKTEDQLRSSKEQLRNLFAHLQTVRETEREKIAREIHDEFGTMLTALKIDISWLGKKVAHAHPDTVERLHKDLELLSSAIKTVQRISSELRPGILDHLGLAAAIEWQVKEFATRMGIQ